MSLATGEDLASFRLGHSQDVLKLYEMVQLRHLFLRQAFFLLSLDQLSDSALRFGRGQEIRNRFRSCARGDELDNLEIGGARQTHSVLIAHPERPWVMPLFSERTRCPAYHARSRCLVRPDAVGDFEPTHVLSHFEIVIRLKIHPKLRSRSEVTGQAECCVRCDSPLSAHDVRSEERRVGKGSR